MTGPLMNNTEEIPDSGTTLREDIAAMRREAADLLRRTGMVVNLQASRLRLDVVCDDIEVRSDGESFRFLIDGTDLSDKLYALKIAVSPLGDTVVTPIFRPRALIRVNREPTPEELKIGVRRMALTPAVGPR
ncbi:MAG: hypothetical protein V2B18_02060 [Pseudomonadota bacterium]